MLLLITLLIMLGVVFAVVAIVLGSQNNTPSNSLPVNSKIPTQAAQPPFTTVTVPIPKPTKEPHPHQEKEPPLEEKTMFSLVNDTDDTYMMPCENDNMCSSGLKCQDFDNRDGETQGFERRGAELLHAKTTLSRIEENAKIPNSMRCRCPGEQVFNTKVSKCQKKAGQYCSITSDQKLLKFPSKSVSYEGDVDTYVTEFKNDCYFQEGVNTHPGYKSSSEMGCFRNLHPSMIVDALSGSMHDDLVLEQDSQYRIGFCIHKPEQTDIGKSITLSKYAPDHNKDDSHIYGHIPNDHRIFKLHHTESFDVPASDLSGVIHEVTSTHVTIKTTNSETYTLKYEHEYCNRACQQAPLTWCPYGPWDGEKCTNKCNDTNKNGKSMWKQNNQACWCSHGPWDATQMKCTDGCKNKFLNAWDYNDQKCISDWDLDQYKNFKAFFGDDLRKDGTVLKKRQQN